MSHDNPCYKRWVIITAVNNDEILSTNLAASPLVAEGKVQLHIERGHASASRAYNTALDKVSAEIAILSHQDVYLPRGWEHHLLQAIARLEQARKNWAVLGIFGVDGQGASVGRVCSVGIGKEIGKPLNEPRQVMSVDEMAIVLRTAAAIRFDEALPGFHLYGTDIVQTSLRMGFENFVFDGAAIHNSQPKFRHYLSYYEAYVYMQRKWWNDLPLPTCNGAITRSRWPPIKLALMPIERRFAKWVQGYNGHLHPVPGDLARQLGYELNTETQSA